MSLAAEICLVLSSVLIYASYHGWLFYVHGPGLGTSAVINDKHADLFSRGKIARILFAEMICNEDDTICGIQQNRNCLLGVAFLAGTVSLIAQKVLSIILSADQLDQIKNYGVRLLSNINVFFVSADSLLERYVLPFDTCSFVHA
jgi:hypothetical protein